MQSVAVHNIHIDVKRKLNLKTLKTFVVTLIVLIFFASVPFAIYYNQNYNRFGTIGREQTSVFLTVVAIDSDRQVAMLKLTAAEYTQTLDTVKILVMPLKRELMNDVKWNIAIINENGVLHAFVEPNLQPHEIQHCAAYLERLGNKEGILLSVKDKV